MAPTLLFGTVMNAPALLAGGLLGAALLAAGPAPARAETVALFPATGINLHEGLLAASSEVMRGHLTATGRFTVVVPAAGSERQDLGPAQLAEEARALGAQQAVTLRITRLASTARVQLTAYDVQTGRQVFFDELPAASPDDLDPVLQRLARAFASGEPARDNADIETVSEKESDPYLKRAATSSFGIKLGSLFAFDRAVGDASSVPGLGIFWLYDARSFLADISVDLYNTNHSTLFAVGLGGYYPLGRENLVPYLGGGLKWAGGGFGGRGAGSGLLVNGAVGALFGRLSTLQVRGELGYFVSLFGEREVDPSSFQPAGPRHYAHGPSIALGLSF